MLTGLTLIRNGNRLKYPWKACIKQLLHICDEVVVGLGQSDDGTLYDLCNMAHNDSRIKIHYSEWNLENKHLGSELAIQTNLALSLATQPWVLYLQADEFIGEWERDFIRNKITTASNNISQFELYRTYFWGDLQHRAPEHELYLGRIFKRGTHEVGGDGMYLIRHEGEVERLENKLIYHYSRIGTEVEVTQRIRTLDNLFHEQSIINTFKDFSYDEITKLISYNGPHPKEVLEYYEF